MNRHTKPLSFLRPLAFTALLSLLLLVLAACGEPTATTAPATSAAANPTTAANTTQATSNATTATNLTTANNTTAANPTTANPTTAGTAVATAATGDTTPQIVAAANDFLATLDSTQKAAVLFDFSNNAQKARWSNLPEGGYSRAGLMWGNLNDTQRQAWLKIMAVTMSKEGYQRVLSEWNGDDALAASGNGMGGGNLLFGSKYYWIALIGTPSATSPWLWQWGGHHVTVIATISGSNVALTPSFIGAQPTSYKDANGNTVTPLGDIDTTAIALLNSLTADQKAKAVLGSNSIDLVLGPGQDGKKIAAEGLPGSAMTADQQQTFLTLMGYYGNLLNAEDAAVRMANLKANLAQTYFAWYGSTTNPAAGYFRVTGPTIVIEYSPQGAMGGRSQTSSISTTVDHIHGIYRDPTNDYGAAIINK